MRLLDCALDSVQRSQDFAALEGPVRFDDPQQYAMSLYRDSRKLGRGCQELPYRQRIRSTRRNFDGTHLKPIFVADVFGRPLRKWQRSFSKGTSFIVVVRSLCAGYVRQSRMVDQATAAAKAANRSPGNGYLSRQVIAIGISPSWLT